MVKHKVNNKFLKALLKKLVNIVIIATIWLIAGNLDQDFCSVIE